MKKNERETELIRIDAHLISVMSDCVSYRNRLEEIGCKREAKLLYTIAGKLYDLTCKLEQKF